MLQYSVMPFLITICFFRGDEDGVRLVNLVHLELAATRIGV